MLTQTPPAWLFDRLKRATAVVGNEPASAYARNRPISVRRISLSDLGLALRRGVDDFAAKRTDILFLCLIYPVVGLILGRFASGYDLLPLLFPLVSGFALVGPIAAVGLNDMSRRRERGDAVTWTKAFSFLHSPAIGSIVLMGLLLAGILVIWLVVAQLIYAATIGTAVPISLATFAHDVVTTPDGWALAVVGIVVGFMFAVVVLSISVISFPLLLDRNVGISAAITTSMHAVMANPVPMAAWGMIVAVLLAVGSVPVFLGLIVVMPILGHATWHLYRAVVR